MKYLKFLVAMLGSLMLTLGVASVAQAEQIPPKFGGGTVDVRFGDFRYPAGSGCFTHRGYLDVFANDDYGYNDFIVSLDLTVQRNGQWVDGWFDTAEWSGSYALDASICKGIDPTGTYEVAGTVTFEGYVDVYNPDCQCFTEEWQEEDVYVSDTFVVRAPHTAQIYASKDPWRAHGWKVNGAVKYDGRAWTGKRVYFQVKRSGSWRTITSKVTNSRGRVAFTYTPPRGTAKPYRLYTKASAGVSAKASKVLYLRRR